MYVLIALLIAVQVAFSVNTLEGPGFLTLSCPSDPGVEPGIANACRNKDLTQPDGNSLTAVTVNMNYYYPNYDIAELYLTCFYGGSDCGYSTGASAGNAVSRTFGAGTCPPPLPVATAGAMGRRGGFEARDTTLARADKRCATASSDGKVRLSAVKSRKNVPFMSGLDADVPGARYSCTYDDLRTEGLTTFNECFYDQDGNYITVSAYSYLYAANTNTPPRRTYTCPVTMCDFKTQFAKRDELKLRQWQPKRRASPSIASDGRVFRKRRSS